MVVLFASSTLNDSSQAASLTKQQLAEKLSQGRKSKGCVLSYIKLPPLLWHDRKANFCQLFRETGPPKEGRPTNIEQQLLALRKPLTSPLLWIAQ